MCPIGGELSFIFLEPCGEQLVDVEITRGGDLILHEYDIDEDITLEEMGYETSRCLQLVKDWEEEPVRVLVDRMYLDFDVALRLGVDWVRHVIEQLTEEEQEQLETAQVYEMLEMIEGVAHDEFDRIAMSRLWKHHVSIREGRFDFFPTIRAVTVAKSAGSVMRAASTVAAIKKDALNYSYQQAVSFIKDNLTKAAVAVRKDFKSQEEREEEGLWQIRRFVDVITAVQSKKKRYPPLEATE